jgi:hypothetical protein
VNWVLDADIRGFLDPASYCPQVTEKFRLLFQDKSRMREFRPYGSVRGCVKNAFFGARCCIRDEGGPFGAGLQEQASNSRKLLSSNGDGGERYGKGVRKSRHV